jgi:hypothetical protein
MIIPTLSGLVRTRNEYLPANRQDFMLCEDFKQIFMGKILNE